MPQRNWSAMHQVLSSPYILGAKALKGVVVDNHRSEKLTRLSVLKYLPKAEYVPANDP